MARLFTFLAFFFYLYSTQFVFVPGHVGTRALMGVIGFVLFYIRFQKRQIDKRIVRNFKYILRILLPIPIVSILTMLVNLTNDFEFVKYFFSISLMFFASYFVCCLLKYSGQTDFYEIVDLLKNVVLVQLAIAFVAFIIPPIKDLIIGLQIWSDSDNFEKTVSVRLIGLGSSFFGAGITHAFCLTLIAYKMLTKRLSGWGMTKEVFAYLFILFIGLFMSRVSVLGLSTSFALFLFTKRVWIRNRVSTLIPSILT